MKNGDSESGFEDYVNMDHMGQPASVATRRTSRQSGIDDPMPFQPDAVRMRNNNFDDEEIYEICYDYKAKFDDELDLRRGSVVKVVKDAESGWYQGLVDGKSGLIPKNYIRALGPCNSKKISSDDILITSLIGEGGAGEVYHATYQGKSVAFKKFKLLGREREREDIVIEKIIYNVKREAAHFARLRHENIVELYGVCFDYPNIGLVLELCQGGALSTVYRKVINAAVPKRILVDWAQQICAAMEACAGKFVHRDLKMDNVLVLQKVCFCALPKDKSMPDRPNADLYSHENIQANGVCSSCGGTAFDRLTLKLTDFGLSRETSPPDNRQSVLAAGTSAWIAPEAYQKNDYSEYSDVWSFGVILWELVTRKQPYENITDNAMIPFFVATGGIRLETTKEFPAHIAHIIKECLQMEPEKRPTFREIRKMLQSYMEDLLRVNDQTEYIEQQKLEAALRKDIKELKRVGAYDDHMKFIEDQLRKYQADKKPKPAERTPIHKKVDKSQIGEPTEPRILLHIPAGGTLPRNINWMEESKNLLEHEGIHHEPLKPSLSKSQPNLNQIHASPQKMSRDRHQGIRKKKERVHDDSIGFDDMQRESSGNFDDHDMMGSPFSQSHDERPHSSMTGAGEKRGSDGSVSFKRGRNGKELHSKKHFSDKLFNFFRGKRDGRSPAPRHSSVSVDSNEDPQEQSTPSPSRSQSVSSALLYNTMRTPIDVGMMYGHSEKAGGKSPDRRTSNGVAENGEDRKKKTIMHTHNTKTYTKFSPMSHPASSPAGMSNPSFSPTTTNGYSATNSAYSTLSSTAGNSRPSGLYQQQPLHHQESNSSSTSNTPVGLDEQYPPGGGGVVDLDYHQLHPSIPPPPRLPPDLPPRRRHGDHFHPGLSTVIPVEQSSPTHMDLSTLPGTLRGRSRTVSGCTADSPVGFVSSSPYIDLPPNAAVVTNGGGRGGDHQRQRDSSPDYITNPSYEPYRQMTRPPCSPPLTDPPPLPPALPPKTHPVAAAALAAEYLTLSSK